ncbi:radical SAM protein [Chitinispirillales bacterium ANBcel5]|uniref:radical SAM protein n=1 Tax=Cellulosispirillum alkaliphilum TaxID=3039283 RepID=UPI002A50CB87|nr:radical SAM protein [Chitinispirillales bacterium ANBcel5]
MFPFYASFKLTSRCHFGCPFCNVKKNAVPDLTTEQIKAVMDNLSRSSVLMTSFEGGEPLLRDDIEELLQYAQRCHFYLLFTTSVKNLTDYPLEKYAQYIDFLHVSIDEGHDNLSLFDSLDTLTSLNTQVSVQTVVTAETVQTLEQKVKRCFDTGANIVIIPAAKMDNAQNCFPDMKSLKAEVEMLRKKYPNTIHTPGGFFKAWENGKCSSASTIIAPDGHLYYPCHILGNKGADLKSTDLSAWLLSQKADSLRKQMKRCKRNCGWYQYYSIASYTSLTSVLQALGPVLRKRKQRQ